MTPNIPKSETIKYILKAICIGQLLALCNAGTAVTSQLLTHKIKVQIPTTQSFLTYLVLSLTYGFYHMWHYGLFYFKSKTGLWCIFLACTDFAATFLMVKAYQYTSLVSVQLLDCFSIPIIMILTYLVFKIRYHYVNYLAVFICISGVGIMIFVDAHENESLKGDMMVIGGAALYGINNVCLEWLAKDIGTYAYLGTYCWFGLLISGIQLAIVERDALYDAPWDNVYFYCYLLGFVLLLFIFLSIMPLIMVRYSATVANLNLLAADVYSAIAGYIIFAISFSLLYIAAVVLILSGVLLYIYRTHLDTVASTASEIKETSSLVIGNVAIDVKSELGAQKVDKSI